MHAVIIDLQSLLLLLLKKHSLWNKGARLISDKNSLSRTDNQTYLFQLSMLCLSRRQACQVHF